MFWSPTNMHNPNPGVICTRIVQIVENWDNDFQDITTFQNMEHKLAVMLTQLPEENKKLLVEMNLKHSYLSFLSFSFFILFAVSRGDTFAPGGSSVTLLYQRA